MREELRNIRRMVGYVGDWRGGGSTKNAFNTILYCRCRKGCRVSSKEGKFHFSSKNVLEVRLLTLHASTCKICFN